jgi:hypothetical protein
MGLTIGGVSYDQYLRRGTLQHVNALSSEPDTLDFQLVVGAPKPSVGSEVIYTLPGGSRLFGGVLMNQPEVKAAFLKVAYVPACSDWRWRADAKVLNDRFVDTEAGPVVVALFAKYAPEFDTSGVDLGGPVIRSIRFERGARLTEALDRLAALTGYVWDITPDKAVVWQPAGALVAPMSLTDTSRNFSNLSVTVDATEVKNRIFIEGGVYPATTPTVDNFIGDGLSTGFRLSQTPASLDDYVVFEDAFNSLDLGKWVKTSPSNPTPPAGHIASDGYLFTTLLQGASLAESGWLQVVGGNGTWGDVRLTSYLPQGRGDGGRRFEFDVYATSATGEGRVGLWDPSNLGALAGEAWGFFFDDGTIKPSLGGVAQTALATVTYTAGKTVRVRIIPKVTAGATLWVNTDDTGDTGLPADQRVAWRPSQWTKLYDTNTGSLANVALVPIFNKDFNGRVDRAKVFNRIYGASLTVGGVEKVLGLLNVDNDSGCDALIGIGPGGVPVLSFFGDTKPGSGAAVALTYYRGIPINIVMQDDAAIAAMKAIENPTNDPLGSDGIKDGFIKDPTINTIEMAQLRGLQDLEQFANPPVTVGYQTRTTGLRAGQVVPANLTLALSGRDLVGSYLIQQVETASLGSDVYEATVTAGSRLKGLSEYLRDLHRAGRTVDEENDENTVITEIVFASDTLTFTDEGSVEGVGISATDTITFTDLGSVESGPVGPFRYGFDAGQPALTFTRTTPAYLNGTSYAAGVARFPSQSGTRGVLVEEAATNRLLWSDDLSNAAWVKQTGGTGSLPVVTANYAAAPDGSMTANRVQLNRGAGTTASDYSNVQQLVTGLANPHTTSNSIWLKSNTASNQVICLFNNQTGQQYTVTVTPTWQTFKLENQVAPFTYDVCQIILIGNKPCDQTADVLVWRAFNQSGAYATTDIKTTTATATRNAETLTVPTTGLLTPSAGTVIIRSYWDAVVASSSTSIRRLFDHTATGDTNQLILYKLGANLSLQTGNGSGSLTTINWASTLGVGWHDTGFRFGSGAVSLWANGTNRAQNLAANVPAALDTTFKIGSGKAGNQQWNNPIAYVVFYNRILSDAEMAQATLGNLPPDFTAHLSFVNGQMDVTTFTPAQYGLAAYA